MSSLEARLRDANPVPDAIAEFGDDDLGALLTLTRARSGDMDIKEMTTPVTPDEKPGRGWLVAVGAAAVVLLAVGAVLFLSGGTDDVPSATAPSTTLDASTETTVASADGAATVPALDTEAAAVVEGMVAAINAGDAESAVEPILEAGEYVSSRSAPEGSNARAAVAGRWAYWAEIESRIEVLGCAPTTSGMTRCELARTSPFDYSSPDPELFTIQVRLADGRVAFMVQEPVVGAWTATELAFNTWVFENHRDIGAQMFVDFSDPQRSADLMRQYYPEWLATRGS
jgi:hypothetical protein